MSHFLKRYNLNDAFDVLHQQFFFSKNNFILCNHFTEYMPISSFLNYPYDNLCCNNKLSQDNYLKH